MEDSVFLRPGDLLTACSTNREIYYFAQDTVQEIYNTRIQKNGT